MADDMFEQTPDKGGAARAAKDEYNARLLSNVRPASTASSTNRLAWCRCGNCVIM